MFRIGSCLRGAVSFVALALVLWPAGPASPADPSPPPGLQADPALGGGPGGIAAVWVDGREAEAFTLYWARLPASEPDTSAVPLLPGPAGAGKPWLAMGEEWGLAVWQAWDTGGAFVAAAELPESPGPAPAAPQAVTAGEGMVWRPAAAVREDVVVLVWEDERVASGDLYVARWDRGRGPRDASGIPLAVGPAEAHWPRIAAGDAGFLAVWSEAAPGASYRVMALPLDAEGAVSGVPVYLSEAGAEAEWPDVSFAAGRFLVVWEEVVSGSSRIEGRYVAENGTLLDALRGPVTLGRPVAPRVAGAVTGFALAWQELGPGGRELRRAWVDLGGSTHPVAGVSVTAPEDYAADLSLAVTGTTATLAWRKPLQDDEDDLYAISVAAFDTETVGVPYPLTVLPRKPTLGGDVVGPRPAFQGIPNPFRQAVKFVLQPEGTTAIDLFDARGARVRRLWPDGDSRWRWDGRSEAGALVPAGVYLARRWPDGAVVRLVRLP